MGMPETLLEPSFGSAEAKDDNRFSQAKENNQASAKGLSEVFAEQAKTQTKQTPAAFKTNPVSSKNDIVEGTLEHNGKNNHEADGEETHEPDPDDSVDIGTAIYWSLQTREKSKPQSGEGYFDTMKRVGEELLGRSPTVEELKALSSGARALQESRGKSSTELSSKDELLPKNSEELQRFFDAMEEKRGPLSGRVIDKLKADLLEVCKQHISKSANELDFSTRPVTDQPVVTKVVPSAVYIDSSHIEGGQGYRRKEDCNSETQTYWLSKSTADAFMRAQKALQAQGKEAVVLRNMNAAGRRALDRELIKKCAPNQPHAKKRSTHEDGISIDVDNYDNLDVRAALEKEGFVRNVKGDRPHFTRFK